jgi:hypothetical protein
MPRFHFVSNCDESVEGETLPPAKPRIIAMAALFAGSDLLIELEIASSSLRSSSQRH